MIYITSLLLSFATLAHGDVASQAATNATTSGRPLVFSGLVRPQPPVSEDHKDQVAEQITKMLPALLGGLGGGAGLGGSGGSSSDGWTYGNMNPSPEPSADVDYENYQYPKDHVFGYGGFGGGDIGNGLCTGKNKDRVQVKNGYCQILKEVLESSPCARKAMDSILASAGPTGSGVGDLLNYCPTYGAIGTGNRILVFQQLLAGLITKESGWNVRAAEKPWTKNGQPMGGKGLMQIGVNDRTQDADCENINATSIMDARTNITCGACIALKNLAKDRTIGHGSGDQGGSKGLAAYFGPFRDGQAAKRQSIASATKQYCVASTGGGSDQSRQVASSGRGATAN